MSTNFLSNQNLLKQQRGAEFNKATSSYLGTVRPDGTTISINSSGTISAVTATSSVTGIVRPDGTSIAISGGSISIATSSNGFGMRTVSTGSPSGGVNGDIWYQY
jgi:hypothetical protein